MSGDRWSSFITNRLYVKVYGNDFVILNVFFIKDRLKTIVWFLIFFFFNIKTKLNTVSTNAPIVYILIHKISRSEKCVDTLRKKFALSKFNKKKRTQEYCIFLYFCRTPKRNLDNRQPSVVVKRRRRTKTKSNFAEIVCCGGVSKIRLFGRKLNYSVFFFYSENTFAILLCLKDKRTISFSILL